MAKDYYTLVLDYGTYTHGWCDEFGSYDLQECIEEFEFTYLGFAHPVLGSKNWSRKHMKILKTDGSLKALKSGLKELNKGYEKQRRQAIKNWRKAQFGVEFEGY